VRKLFICNRC